MMYFHFVRICSFTFVFGSGIKTAFLNLFYLWFGVERSDSNEIPNSDATASEPATNPPKMKQKLSTHLKRTDLKNGHFFKRDRNVVSLDKTQYFL